MNNAAMPVYVQIADKLRHNIQQGVYGVEKKLPSEASLSQQFGVNRHTLRQAIALLKQEGLVRVDRGRGIFVADQPIRYPIGKRVRYNETLEAQGRKGRYETLHALEVPATTKVAERLQMAQGEPVVQINLLGFADSQPLILTTSYFPAHRFPDLVVQFQDTQSISKLMREAYDCDHIRRCTYVSARLVRHHDARLLKLSLNQPILLVESVNVDQHEQPIEYGVTRFRGDSMELVLETFERGAAD